MKTTAAINKIFPLQELLTICNDWRKKGESIAFTNGVFDIVHVGHLASLEQAAQFADRMIVAINSDSSVKTLNKGKGRPILGEQDRAKLIAGFAVVDAVVIFKESTPYEILSQIRPDVLVKGADYQMEQIIGREFAGRVERIELIQNRSTTDIIKKIKMSGSL